MSNRTYCRETEDRDDRLKTTDRLQAADRLEARGHGQADNHIAESHDRFETGVTAQHGVTTRRHPTASRHAVGFVSGRVCLNNHWVFGRNFRLDGSGKDDAPAGTPRRRGYAD